MLKTLAIANYRSLRNLVIPLGQLNVITGANGSGKSNIYRALRLLSETANGRLISSLAREGGLSSTLWAGPEGPAADTQGDPANLRLGFSTDNFGYSIDLGLPAPSQSAFELDPEIKREVIWGGRAFRANNVLVDRRGPTVIVRDKSTEEGWKRAITGITTFDSMLTQFVDPRSVPEMVVVREQIRTWRFYDHFRSDADAFSRFPQIGTHSPVLSNDGSNLAATLQTIREIGDAKALDVAIEDAFPGSSIEVTWSNGRFETQMRQQGLLRPLSAAELSDGTLRYLLCVAALLSPRPPGVLVLNEPETSLHPDLLPALGRLIARTAAQTQIIVVSHAAPLVEMLENEIDCYSIHLEKECGATVVNSVDRAEWYWAAR